MKITTAQAQELSSQLSELPDIRKARGKRHPAVSILAIAICAMLSGYSNFTTIAEWAKRCSQSTLKRLGCYFHEGKQCYVAPSEPTIRRILQSQNRNKMEQILNRWITKRSLEQTDEEAVAVDGKVLKGARDDNEHKTHLLSAVLHEQGTTIAQLEVEKKSNEIPSVRTLLDPLDISNQVVTLDALHTQKKTAKYLVEEKQAYYFFTVKGNQPTLKADIELLNLNQTFPEYETVDKGHGRVETRRIWTSTALNNYLIFPHVGQVFCVQRHVFDCKKKKERQETVYGITALTPAQADPKRLLKLNRGHWSIENRSHYVRDVTFDEDKSQIRTGSGPQVMACLRNFAIGTLRVIKNASNIASALRDIAAKPHRALELIGL